MKRSKIEPKLIDHRDANAKELVWLVLHDGSRLLYGHKRLAIEYRLNLATFHYRWCKAGKPDEITLGMLAPAEGSYHGRAGQTPVAAPVVIEDIPAPHEPQPAKPSAKFLLLPDNTLHTAREIDRMFNVPVSTLNKRAEKGQTTYTRDELATMQRQFRDAFHEPPPPVFPRNIDEVEYHPSTFERALLRCR